MRQEDYRVQIRQAGLSDLPKISFLLKSTYSQSYIKKQIHHEEILVALVDNFIRGVAIFSNSFFGDCLLELIYVEEEFREFGIGKQLLKQVEKQVLGLRLIVLISSQDLKLKQTLMNKGFISSGIVHNMHQDIQICLIKDVKQKLNLKNLDNPIEEYRLFLMTKLINFLNQKTISLLPEHPKVFEQDLDTCASRPSGFQW